MLKHELFNQDMVKAFLDGRKTQTRRPIRIQPPPEWNSYRPITNEDGVVIGHRFERSDDPDFGGYLKEKPKYQPGDLMGIRERARMGEWSDDTIFGGQGKAWFSYEADHALTGWMAYPERLKLMTEGHCVPNGCFKELVRLFYKVFGVRVERIQDISLPDCLAEGITGGISLQQIGMIKATGDGDDRLKELFADLWDSIYPGSWERNDWVFAYGLERCEKP